MLSFERKKRHVTCCILHVKKIPNMVSTIYVIFWKKIRHVTRKKIPNMAKTQLVITNRPAYSVFVKLNQTTNAVLSSAPALCHGLNEIKYLIQFKSASALQERTVQKNFTWYIRSSQEGYLQSNHSLWFDFIFITWLWGVGNDRYWWWQR